ncbi:MAG: helix-turn-helix transcriptional regulator [Myxococcota bacterium]
MRVVARRPEPPLRRWVASIWYFEGEDLAHHRERIVPNGCMQLLVNLEEDRLRWWEGPSFARALRLRGQCVAGAFSRPFAIGTAEQRCVTGVSFTPGGGASFLGRGTHELANDHAAFQGPRDRLLAAHASDSSGAAVLDTWERWLRERLSPLPAWGLDGALRSLEEGKSVQETADALTISVRTLRSKFSSQVGLSPKTYARVHRVQRLLKHTATSTDWADAAVAHGYFDQAHLIHEFRALTGTTPSAYQARSEVDANHSILG